MPRAKNERPVKSEMKKSEYIWKLLNALISDRSKTPRRDSE